MTEPADPTPVALRELEWLTMPQLAAYLTIPVTGAYKLAHRLGYEPRPGVGLRVSRTKIDEYMAQRAAAAPDAGTPPACPAPDDDELVAPGLTRAQLRERTTPARRRG